MPIAKMRRIHPSTRRWLEGREYVPGDERDKACLKQQGMRMRNPIHYANESYAALVLTRMPAPLLACMHSIKFLGRFLPCNASNAIVLLFCVPPPPPPTSLDNAIPLCPFSTALSFEWDTQMNNDPTPDQRDEPQDTFSSAHSTKEFNALNCIESERERASKKDEAKPGN